MWQEDLAQELNESIISARTGIIEKYRGQTGYSRQQLYRIAAKYGYDSGKSQRKDAGVLRCELNGDQIRFIANLMWQTRREVKGPIMPVERAIQIAELNGIIKPGQVTPSTINRILRERQMSKKHMMQPAPHTNMRSLHPNHTHVFDSSTCIQYYLKNGKMGIMDERDYYDNKPQNSAKIKTRLLRYVITDHFSGAYYFRYFDTTGETAENLWAFLKEAWAPKSDTRFPLRGVPFNLLMDAGSANISRSITGFLGNLDVNIPRGMPYNSRRQGVTEVQHNILECWCESGLRIQPAHTVEEINAWMLDAMIAHQLTKTHTRHGMTRTAAWMQIKQEELRELPSEELLQELFANPRQTRNVRNYSISFKGMQYNLKHLEGLHQDAIVNVILKPFKFPTIDVEWRDVVYECQPIEMLPAHLGGFRADAAIIGEEFKAQPETAFQMSAKLMDNEAFGEKSRKKAIPFEGLQVFGRQTESLPENIALLPRKGTPLEVDRRIVEKHIPIGEFLMRYVKANGPISKELNQYFRGKYGNSIEVKEAEEVIRGGYTEAPQVSRLTPQALQRR